MCLQIAQLSTERCGGFRILSHREFFPIPFSLWRLFFDESTSQHVMDEIKDCFGVHLWNKLSKNTTVNAGSQQPYSLMAATACPRMYAVCGGCLWRRRDAKFRHSSDVLSGQITRLVTITAQSRVRASFLTVTHCGSMCAWNIRANDARC